MPNRSPPRSPSASVYPSFLKRFGGHGAELVNGPRFARTRWHLPTLRLLTPSSFVTRSD
jgi:hypothetical protein